IDVARGSPPVKTNLRKLTALSSTNRKLDRTARRTPVADVAPLKIRRDVYQEVQPLEKEIGRARDLHLQVYRAVGAVMEQVDGNHHNIPIQETKRVASHMVDSVIRSPDAFTWLSRVKEKDEYTYSHAVRSAVWAILFGRHIGLPK